MSYTNGLGTVDVVAKDEINKKWVATFLRFPETL